MDICTCVQEKLQAKGDQEREQMMAKLTELHAAYKKTKARMLQLSQEQEAMQRDNAELQSKMAEKARRAPALLRRVQPHEAPDQTLSTHAGLVRWIGYRNASLSERNGRREGECERKDRG